MFKMNLKFVVCLFNILSSVLTSSASSRCDEFFQYESRDGEVHGKIIVPVVEIYKNEIKAVFFVPGSRQFVSRIMVQFT